MSSISTPVIIVLFIPKEQTAPLVFRSLSSSLLSSLLLFLSGTSPTSTGFEDSSEFQVVKSTESGEHDLSCPQRRDIGKGDF